MSGSQQVPCVIFSMKAINFCDSFGLSPYLIIIHLHKTTAGIDCAYRLIQADGVCLLLSSARVLQTLIILLHQRLALWQIFLFNAEFLRFSFGFCCISDRWFETGSRKVATTFKYTGSIAADNCRASA